MAERDTAEAQLARLLQLLPRATRAGGVPLAELARELDVTEKRVLDDLEEIYTRAYYHPAGSAGDVQVVIDADEVRIFTTREFRRPPRLSRQETLALGLGLRVLAAESAPGARPGMLALAERLESGVLGSQPELRGDRIALNPGADSPAGIRSTLIAAARERRRCSIAYLRPGAPEPEAREVDPYVIMAVGGHWYLIAFCHRHDEVRVFRADRVVEVEPLGERFEPPREFDPQAYVREGRVFRAGDEVAEVDVPVRYSARIARWIEENGPVEKQEDGSVIVRYRVADPDWLVRHVLEHGPDAEILGPPEMRQRMVETIRRIRANF